MSQKSIKICCFLDKNRTIKKRVLWLNSTGVTLIRYLYEIGLVLVIQIVVIAQKIKQNLCTFLKCRRSQKVPLFPFFYPFYVPSEKIDWIIVCCSTQEENKKYLPFFKKDPYAIAFIQSIVTHSIARNVQHNIFWKLKVKVNWELSPESGWNDNHCSVTFW